jgi:magnesium-transporting ATPase (P-type)
MDSAGGGRGAGTGNVKTNPSTKTCASSGSNPGSSILTGEDLAEYQSEALQEALTEVNVFARVRAEQKLQLVESLQAQSDRMSAWPWGNAART